MLPVSQEFDQHCAQLALKYHVSIQTKQDALQICGFKDTTGEVKELVHKFMKMYTVNIQKGIWCFFGSAMKQKWIKIENECHDTDMILTQLTDDEEKIPLALKRDKDEVQKILQATDCLIGSVRIIVVPLMHPKIHKYFSEREDGGMKIPHIERSAKVCIEICEVGKDTSFKHMVHTLSREGVYHMLERSQRLYIILLLCRPLTLMFLGAL